MGGPVSISHRRNDSYRMLYLSNSLVPYECVASFQKVLHRMLLLHQSLLSLFIIAPRKYQRSVIVSFVTKFYCRPLQQLDFLSKMTKLEFPMKIAINLKKWLNILNILQNALKLSLVIADSLIDHIDKLAHALGLEPHGNLVFLPCAEQFKNLLDLVHYFGRMAELHMASNLA